MPYRLCRMEHFRSTGDYPRQLVSVFTPIHKKGDVRDPSNYRGLVVGGAQSKLYAFLFERRLTALGDAIDHCKYYYELTLEVLRASRPQLTLELIRPNYV